MTFIFFTSAVSIDQGHITDADRIGEKMARILHVPEEYELVCFLPVGTAEAEPVLPSVAVPLGDRFHDVHFFHLRSFDRSLGQSTISSWGASMMSTHPSSLTTTTSSMRRRR